MGGGRPLSPINEANSNPRRSYHLTNAIVTPSRQNNHSQLGGNSSNTKVSVHPVPTRNQIDANHPVNGDNTGVAQLVHKEPRYVQSIVIGSAGPSPEGNSATLSSVSNSRLAPAPPLPPLPPLSKKPSVTFSERVELVAPKQETTTTTTNNNNGKVLITPQPEGEGQGHESKAQSQFTSSPPYRKPSTEHDSIVTESLLLLTSNKPATALDLNSVNVNVNGNNHNSDRLQLLNYHSSKSGVPEGERKLSSSSSCSGGSGCGGASRIQRNQDLEAFSILQRKNHPVKHILSNSGKSLEISQPRADHYSSNEYLDHDHHNNHHKSGAGLLGDDESSVGSDGQGLSFSETGSSSQEHVDDDDGEDDQQQGDGDEGKRRRRPRGSCPKSAFGGIADHYAAAKEIAKEIESYSNGSAKTNSKKSMCNLFLLLTQIS